MDSGLARFVVLVVLFFLLTGDLTGMVRHLFEESAGGFDDKTGQQEQQRPAQRRTRAAVADKGSSASDGDGPDPDLEAFGKRAVRD